MAIWAYCLMPNHVHLVLVPSTADGLRATLGETHRRYTRRINAREGVARSSLAVAFASYPMDDRHTWAAVRYIERNPVRAGLVTAPADWRWSSARAHLAGEDDGIVTLAPLLEQFGDWAAYLAGGAEAEADTLRAHSRTGRPLGDAEFGRRPRSAHRSHAGQTQTRPPRADELSILSP
ncbi:MAG: transposase [Gammaproteobacteria bacterium]|nr:transposase [Gammaproteobacteria bacterium]